MCERGVEGTTIKETFSLGYFSCLCTVEARSNGCLMQVYCSWGSWKREEHSTKDHVSPHVRVILLGCEVGAAYAATTTRQSLFQYGMPNKHLNLCIVLEILLSLAVIFSPVLQGGSKGNEHITLSFHVTNQAWGEKAELEPLCSCRLMQGKRVAAMAARSWWSIFFDHLHG